MAQVRKLDYLCRKLMLKPGERLLDIGCGWGGLIMYAASHYDVEAFGITASLSRAQLAWEHIAPLASTIVALSGSATIVISINWGPTTRLPVSECSSMLESRCLDTTSAGVSTTAIRRCIPQQWDRRFSDLPKTGRILYRQILSFQTESWFLCTSRPTG